MVTWRSSNTGSPVAKFLVLKSWKGPLSGSGLPLVRDVALLSTVIVFVGREMIIRVTSRSLGACLTLNMRDSIPQRWVNVALISNVCDWIVWMVAKSYRLLIR